MQEPEVLIETRREGRVDSSRDFTRTSTHPEPIVAGGVNVNLNAYLAWHVGPKLPSVTSMNGSGPRDGTIVATR